MRKKYLSALLFGALLVASTGTFTSCKDYDDEINNLQEQVDALKSKTAVSPDEMQTAVSDAISALETKLNQAIAGKADAAEVTELISTVAALQELVNSNDAANKEEIEALKAKIETLSAAVNAIPGDLNTTLEDLKKHKADVEAAIAEINAQLEENGTISAEMDAKLKQLTSDLAEANNNIANVEALAKNNAEAIVSIQAAISDLETLRANITSLQNLKADKEYVDAQIEAIKELIPTDYLTAEGVSAAIESALVNYVSLDFMTAYSTTVEMQNYVGTEIAAALVTVDNKIAAAFTANGYNETDFKAVVAHMTSVNTALTEKGFENFAALVDKVNDLSTNYATVATVTDIQRILNGDGTEENKGLVADVEGLLTWKTTTQSTIDTLKSDVAKLKADVAKLQNMVKSLVYIPSLENRTVRFESIVLDGETISASTDQELLFRVSPASAAENLLDNYEIDLYDDGAVASRSGDNFVLDKKSVKVVKDGVISVKVSALTYKSRAIALALTPKADAEGNKEEYDNITSDYIAAMCDVAQFDGVTFAFGATTGSQGKIDNLKYEYNLYYNGTAEEKTVNLKDECKFYFTKNVGTTSTPDIKYYAVSDYKQLDASQFGVTFKYTAQNSDKITVNKETGVVTVKDGTDSPATARPINAVVTCGSYESSEIQLKVSVATKGQKYEVALDAAELDFKVLANNEFADTNSKYKVAFTLSESEKTRIAAAANLSGFSAIDVSSISVDNLKLPVLYWDGDEPKSGECKVVANNNKNGIVIENFSGKAVKPGTYTLDYTISGTTTIAGESTPIEIKVTKDITVKAPSVPMLSQYKKATAWDGDDVALSLSGGIRSFDVTGTSFFAFPTTPATAINDIDEYNTELNNNGGKLIISLTTDYPQNAAGVAYSGNSITIVESNFDYSKTATLTYKVVSLTGESETFSANLVFNKINGSWTVASNATKQFTIAANTIDSKAVLTGFTWKDEAGFNAWTNGGNTSDAYANNGYDVKYEVISSNAVDLSKYVDLTEEDGKLYLNLSDDKLQLASGASDTGTGSVQFVFRVVPTSPWGTPAGYDAANNEITVQITGITAAQ